MAREIWASETDRLASETKHLVTKINCPAPETHCPLKRATVQHQSPTIRPWDRLSDLGDWSSSPRGLLSNFIFENVPKSQCDQDTMYLLCLQWHLSMTKVQHSVIITLGERNYLRLEWDKCEMSLRNPDTRYYHYLVSLFHCLIICFNWLRLNATLHP